ncbi:uncharacterized protein F4807DRAFT_438041 [Annulohypoxylon truncatum]|uniref:uncharacterized protein n=1 Tax=Annulohypoxylon truncatum TaxID=327061 RepID=UPI00200862EF|nr:uncharacterized protein F4807DRAFT_438041 [Annulohypoxylon truncatum]KAI1206729.1 hypothetical protein F4807DRAFT_438041 [Annulohypoxylon truncatum]
MCGLELPLSVMISFARVEYPIEYKSGYVLKGWENALFPIHTDSESDLSGTPSAIQWHLFTSEKNRLYMIEVERRAKDLHPIATKIPSDEVPSDEVPSDKVPSNKVPSDEVPSDRFWEAVQQIKRHFLGLYEFSRIRIGTNESVSGNISRISGHLRETRFRSLIQWNRSISGSIEIPMFGIVSIGFSTGIRIREAQERRFRFDQVQTDSQMLHTAKRDSVILYDFSASTAWMLPMVSVVMYLVQSRIRGMHRNARINYPAFEDIIRNDWNFEEFLTQATPDGLKLKETFFQFMKMLYAMQHNESLRPTQRYLAGVDFAKLVHMPRNYSIIKRDINTTHSGKWQHMLESNWTDPTVDDPSRTVTLFCSSLLSLTSQPLVPTTNETCNAWFPPPAGRDYLVAAVHCHWECDVHFPHTPCGGRGCDRLQEIVKGYGQRNQVLTELINTASPSASVVFGERLVIDMSGRCGLVSVPSLVTPPANTASNGEETADGIVNHSGQIDSAHEPPVLEMVPSDST